MNLGNSLYLHRVKVSATAHKTVSGGVNRVYFIDISGSMSGELGKLARQFKEQLLNLLGAQDTVSLIAFSGRNQAYLVLDNVPVKQVAELREVYSAIDARLRPVGLTGFKEPLQLGKQLQDKIRGADKDAVISLFFMSDGCNNQDAEKDILAAAEALRPNAATVVEYGPYADRRLLSKIAEIWGAGYIYAKDFAAYAPAAERATVEFVNAAPRVEVQLDFTAVGNVAYGYDEQNIYVLAIADNKVMAPAGIDAVYYVAPEPSAVYHMSLTALYAGLSVYAMKGLPVVMYGLLRQLGDKRFVTAYQSCFGKTRYGDFIEMARQATFDEAQRNLDGYDPNAVPAEDALTVLEVLEWLQADESARLMLDHPSFSYNRIGRKRENAAETLSADEAATIDDLAAKAKTDPSVLAEMARSVSEILSRKIAVKFTADPAPDGYPLRGVKYNSKRANILLGVTYTGTVNLAGHGLTHAPEIFPTRIYRDYALLKDGLVNIAVLPVRVSSETKDKFIAAMLQGRLPKNAVLADPTDESILLIGLDQLPVINRVMTAAPSAEKLLGHEYTLLTLQAARKVYKYYLDEWFPVEKGAKFAELYGEADAAILTAAGVTESGFNPKTVAGESTDTYVGYELHVALKGLSSLPKVSDAADALDGKGKMTPAKELLKSPIEIVRVFGDAQTPGMESWLKGMIAKVDAEAQRLMALIARIKFAVIVEQTWFVEAGEAGMEKTDFAVNQKDGTVLSGKIEQKTIEVAI